MILARLLIVMICLMASCTYANQVTTHSPEGYWQTIDDVTGKPKAVVQIWKGSDQLLYGRVLKIFPTESEQNERCTACEGDKHNKHIVKMVILESFTKSKEKANTWIDGRILDPKNGKTYQSRLTMVENGQKLNVTGYIGMPLFGRTQTWQRVSVA